MFRILIQALCFSTLSARLPSVSVFPAYMQIRVGQALVQRGVVLDQTLWKMPKLPEG